MLCPRELSYWLFPLAWVGGYLFWGLARFVLWTQLVVALLWMMLSWAVLLHSVRALWRIHVLTWSGRFSLQHWRNLYVDPCREAFREMTVFFKRHPWYRYVYLVAIPGGWLCFILCITLRAIRS